MHVIIRGPWPCIAYGKKDTLINSRGSVNLAVWLTIHQRYPTFAWVAETNIFQEPWQKNKELLLHRTIYKMHIKICKMRTLIHIHVSVCLWVCTLLPEEPLQWTIVPYWYFSNQPTSLLSLGTFRRTMNLHRTKKKKLLKSWYQIDA